MTMKCVKRCECLIRRDANPSCKVCGGNGWVPSEAAADWEKLGAMDRKQVREANLKSIEEAMDILCLGFGIDGTGKTLAMVAQEAVEKNKSGRVVAMPNSRDEKGNRHWEYVSHSPAPVMHWSPLNGYGIACGTLLIPGKVCGSTKNFDFVTCEACKASASKSDKAADAILEAVKKADCATSPASGKFVECADNFSPATFRCANCTCETPTEQAAFIRGGNPVYCGPCWELLSKKGKE